MAAPGDAGRLRFFFETLDLKGPLDVHLRPTLAHACWLRRQGDGGVEAPKITSAELQVQMQLQNSTSCPVPTPAAPAPQAKAS